MNHDELSPCSGLGETGGRVWQLPIFETSTTIEDSLLYQYLIDSLGPATSIWIHGRAGRKDLPN